MKNNVKGLVMIFVFVLFFSMFAFNVHAAFKMDSINFDPAIVAAGDEVDIIIQFHDTFTSNEEDYVNQDGYTYRVFIEADDSLTENYVTIEDAKGNNLGRVTSGDFYNTVFRVKVANNAPSGNYEFKLVGQWYYEDAPLDFNRYVRFTLPVKKEGIMLDVSTIETTPSEIRPGDDYVKVVGYIENVGEKDAKSVEIFMNLPDGLESSYTNNNRVWVGRVNAGERKEATFFVNVLENTKSDVYDIQYSFSYLDVDDNLYSASKTIPFLVKTRPNIEVVGYEGEGLAGDKGKLYVTVKNIGEDSAESVDIRLLKQNSQPFSIDVRSDYIGELEPGEEGLAVFTLNILDTAELKDHDFKLLIRATGDSDKGDDSVYTFNRRALFKVVGIKENNLAKFGIIGFVIVVIIIVVVNILGKRKNEFKHVRRRR